MQFQIVPNQNNPTPERIAEAAANYFAKEGVGNPGRRTVVFYTDQAPVTVVVRKFDHESGSYGMLWLELAIFDANPDCSVSLECFYNFGQSSGYIRTPA